MTNSTKRECIGTRGMGKEVRGNDSVLSLWLDISLNCFMSEWEVFYLTTHSTHFIYGYMASHI